MHLVAYHRWLRNSRYVIFSRTMAKEDLAKSVPQQSVIKAARTHEGSQWPPVLFPLNYTSSATENAPPGAGAWTTGTRAEQVTLCDR
jgi:hypothetical protein